MRSILFLFLLPVFFVFHGYAENWRNIEARACIPLAAIYCVAALILFGLARLFLKNSLKAALLASFMLAFFFFFGALHDFLRGHHIFLHRYGILLPLFVLMVILIAVRLRRKTPSPRLALFLNSLFLVYILVDAGSLLIGRGGEGQARFSAYPQPAGTYRRCDTCARPDIYFIIFDEYCNSRTLRQTFGYDNHRFDDWLTAQGFHIQPDSRSNYSKTPFSMASILNFTYLDDIRDTAHVGPEDFTNQLSSIRDNEVSRFLGSMGYRIINNCVFDLAAAPATVDLPLIPTSTRLITDRTLLNYLARDLGGWFAAHFNNTQTITTPESNFAYYDQMNHRLIRQTIAESARTDSKPRFVYTHILMPHAPYLYDSLGHPRDPHIVMTEPEAESLDSYLHYIPYTNAVIEDLLTRIRQNTHDKAVVIFMSDHGYRYRPPQGADPLKYYDNQNAIFLPDGDYRAFYPTISAVNEFRAVFNHLFHQQLPILPDSAVRLGFLDVAGW